MEPSQREICSGIKNKFNLSLKEAERVTVASIDRRLDNRPVYANSNMEDLIDKALNQNFVPVVDDQKNFIGIITRKDIIRYYYDKSQECSQTTQACRSAGEKARLVLG